MDIFCADHYLEVLQDKIEENHRVPRYKSLLSRAAKCQPSFLSQVLAKQANLKPEHALGLAEFWRFSRLQTDMFIALIGLERASTPAFLRYCQDRVDEIRAMQKDLTSRTEREDLIVRDMNPRYFSGWYITVIHVLLSIPGHDTEESIATKLCLPIKVVEKALADLKSMGYAESKQGCWSLTESRLHIPRESVFHRIHHGQWRRQSQLAVEEERDLVSYTAVHTLRREDIPLLRARMHDFIEETRSLVHDSDPEEIVALTCDLFTIGSN